MATVGILGPHSYVGFISMSHFTWPFAGVCLSLHGGWHLGNDTVYVCADFARTADTRTHGASDTRLASLAVHANANALWRADLILSMGDRA